MSTLSAEELWQDVLAVRERGPLVHCISNLVALQLNANALLAVGASPVMAHAHEEVADMASLAHALVVNIGTLDPYWIESMERGLARASERGIPTVLDPVGAGATPYRNRTVERLLGLAAPTVLRGNASELMSVAGLEVVTRGVDSSAASEQATRAVQSLVRRTGGTVCVSGATDHVLDASRRWVKLSNGHPWMTRITAVGCSASALIGAFCAVQPDALRATSAAMGLLGVAGELAAEQVRARGQGVGSMLPVLLDGLQLLEREAFVSRLSLEVTHW